MNLPVSEVLTAFIIGEKITLMMKAAGTSETSVKLLADYTAQQLRRRASSYSPL
jgi:hypothetical protein